MDNNLKLGSRRWLAVLTALVVLLVAALADDAHAATLGNLTVWATSGGPAPTDHGVPVTHTATLSDGSHYDLSTSTYSSPTPLQRSTSTTSTTYALNTTYASGCHGWVYRRIAVGILTPFAWRQVGVYWCWNTSRVVNYWATQDSSWASVAYCWEDIHRGVAWWDPSHSEIKAYNYADLHNYFVWGCGLGDQAVDPNIFAKGGGSYNYGS